jgi:hypothetical protein
VPVIITGFLSLLFPLLLFCFFCHSHLYRSAQAVHERWLDVWFYQEAVKEDPIACQTVRLRLDQLGSLRRPFDGFCRHVYWSSHKCKSLFGAFCILFHPSIHCWSSCWFSYVCVFLGQSWCVSIRSRLAPCSTLSLSFVQLLCSEIFRGRLFAAYASRLSLPRNVAILVYWTQRIVFLSSYWCVQVSDLPMCLPLLMCHSCFSFSSLFVFSPSLLQI